MSTSRTETRFVISAQSYDNAKADSVLLGKDLYDGDDMITNINLVLAAPVSFLGDGSVWSTTDRQAAQRMLYRQRCRHVNIGYVLGVYAIHGLPAGEVDRLVEAERTAAREYRASR